MRLRGKTSLPDERLRFRNGSAWGTLAIWTLRMRSTLPRRSKHAHKLDTGRRGENAGSVMLV